MPETKHRRFLREKEAAQLVKEFSHKLKFDLNQLLGNKQPSIEVAETREGKIYFINRKPAIASSKGALVPTLFFEEALQELPKIVVNMGAVPHICNGADLMAPGIVKIEGNFDSNDFVVVVDEKHHKPLAILRTLTDSLAASSLQHGKVAKNVHHIGDSLWNLFRNK